MRYHLIALCLIVLDQITKIWVKGFNILGIKHEGMELGQSIPVINDVVNITYVENAGMAFGITWGEGKIILTLITIVIATVIGVYLAKMKSPPVLPRVAIMLLFAGAVGNLIDRALYGVIFNEGALFYGMVVDFIQVNIPDVTLFDHTYTHYPVFNVADSCVSVGIVLLLITGGRTQRGSV